MLVLTRKQQEKIRIGDEIVITVLRMKGKSVRLGIEAPGDVQVLRGELVFDLRNVEDQSPGNGEQVSHDSPSAVPRGSDEGPGDHRGDDGWSAKSDPALRQDRPKGDGGDFEVSLNRVPRHERPNVIPQLAHEGGPLRSMLQNRSIR